MSHKPHDDRVRVLYGDQIGQLCGKHIDAPRYRIDSLYSAPDQILWVSLSHGLVACADQTIIAEFPCAFPRVISFQNMLWYADYSDEPHIFLYQNGHWIPHAVPFRQCRALQVLQNGALIAAADHSLWISHDGEAWKELFRADTMMAHVWEAQSDVLWWATERSTTLMRYHLIHQQIEPISLPKRGQANPFCGIMAAFPESADRGWISSDPQGLLYWDGNAWSRVPGIASRRLLAPGAPGWVNTFCLDPWTQRLWIGAMGGIAYHENGKWWSVIPAKQEHFTLFGPDNSATICLNNAGRLFMGGAFGALSWIDTHQTMDIRSLSEHTYEEFRLIRLRTL